MNTELIDNLIDNSDMNQMQKNIFGGFVRRSNAIEEKRVEDLRFVSQITLNTAISEVVFSNDDVKIYIVTASKKDDWTIKYPYRSIFKDSNGKWSRAHSVAPTFEVAFLIYLEHKYLGYNSQFSDFAMRMLGIPDVK